MITVKEADQFIHQNLFVPKPETADIEKALGRVLAQQVIADRPFPPFDRISMDGIAFRFHIFEKGIRTFKVMGVAAAGAPQMNLKEENGCLEVMTGAILPNGADTVIRYEDLTIENGEATIHEGTYAHGMNVHNKGIDRSLNEVILEPNNMLRAPELSICATVGLNKMIVKSRPKVAVVTTGDELVEIHEQPKEYQIRKSNNQQITAALKSHVEEIQQIHLIDHAARTKDALEKCLDRFDVIIISGGVSKGKFDFVPDALEQIGVEKLFYKVAQRPGKPFWFGVHHSKNAKVFALPGNPASSFMCTIRYVLPWLHHSMTCQPKRKLKAVLAEDFSFKPELSYFLQVKIESDEDGRLIAFPNMGHGSGDLANLTQVDGFLELPKDRSEFKKGAIFDYYPF